MPLEPNVLSVIADALQSAEIHHGRIGFGPLQNQTYRSTEDCEHAARLIVQRLDAMGFEIRLKAGPADAQPAAC